MEKVKLEARHTYRSNQNVDNRGTFRRPNNSPQILPREPRNKGRDDQRIQTPLQKNLVDEEDDPKIHCLGDTPPSPHLTKSAYGESLMDNQINELRERRKKRILVNII